MKNKLVNENSPYLLQHSSNPVNWFPWGEEAFRVAKDKDLPVFLSIGYSTCHWCHVMEKESFEDEEVALILNKNFISIKVDREQRPDLDSIYMSVCQMMTKRGGWPLTVILTPDKIPFFAGTYFPKNSTKGSVGLCEFLPKVREVWDEKREDVLKSCDSIYTSLKEVSNPNVPDSYVQKEDLKEIFESIKDFYDEKYGEMLGCHIIGAEATNLISEAAIARKLETTWSEVLETIHPHPTLSEGIMEATADALGEAIHI